MDVAAGCPRLHDPPVNKSKIMGKTCEKPINNVIGWTSIVMLVGVVGAFILLPY